MKIKIHDRNFGAFRNEIVKRRTFKLLVREPAKYTIYRKPSGVILKLVSSTTVQKQDAVEGVRMKSNPDTYIHKHNDGVVFDSDSFGVLLREYYTVTTVNESFSYNSAIDELLVSPPITVYNYNNSSQFRFYNSSESTPWLNLDGTTGTTLAAYSGASLAEYFAVNKINTTSILKDLDLSCVPVPYYNNYVYLGEGPTGVRFGLDHFGSGVLITPKHLVHSGHDNYYPMIGQQLRFVNANNEIKFATVAKRTFLTGSFDTALVEFEQDVDASIIPAPILVQKNSLPNVSPKTGIAVSCTPTFCILPNQNISTGYILSNQTFTNPNIIPSGPYGIQNEVPTLWTYTITTDGDVRLKYRYYSRLAVEGDSGSGIFLIYQNSQKTIRIPCLVGNLRGAGGQFSPLGPQLFRIQQQIAAWGNTGDKYKLNILYNKYES